MKIDYFSSLSMLECMNELNIKSNINATSTIEINWNLYNGSVKKEIYDCI
jgi:hypothetical protein